MKTILPFLFVIIFTAGCERSEQSSAIQPLTNIFMKISSSAFENNGKIPSKYTCDGEDIIPPLNFFDVPSNAKSLVLIVDDTDAPGGIWDHWIVYDISPSVAGILEGKAPAGQPGLNSWGNTGYGGPCPPKGEHRYVFKLYALNDNTFPKYPTAPDKKRIEEAMEGKVIDQAQLIGLYSRN